MIRYPDYVDEAIKRAKPEKNHREKPTKINRNWLNSVIKRAFSAALSPKFPGVKKVVVRYRENGSDIARRTLAKMSKEAGKKW